MKPLLCSIAFLLCATAHAQTVTVSYVLEDLWLDPDATHPWESPQQMTGTIAWTYSPGDFENGTGTFTSLNVPWHNGAGPALAWTMDVGQIEVTMPGNWHNWGADVSIKLASPLSLGQSAPVDLVLSKFEIEANGIVRKGSMISGAVAPEPPLTYCTAGTSSLGCQALLSSLGGPSATAPLGFDVTVSGVEGGKDGIFFFGTSGRQANSWGNGTSFQCVVPPTVRTGLTTAVGMPGTCDGTASIDLNATWTSTPAKNPGAGALVDLQFWYRDPANTSNRTTSLSNALEFTVGT